MEADSSSQPEQPKLGAFYWIDSPFRTDKTAQKLPAHFEELLEKYSKEYGKPVETLYSWDPSAHSFVPVESDTKMQRLLVARREELTQGKLATVSLCAITRAIHKALEYENLRELPYDQLYAFVLQEGDAQRQIPRFTWKPPSLESLQVQRSAAAADAGEAAYFFLRLLGEAFKITTTFQDRRKPFTILSGCLGQILADAARPHVTDHVVEVTLMLISLLLADHQVVQTLTSEWVVHFAAVVKNVRLMKIWLCVNTDAAAPSEATKATKKPKKSPRSSKHGANSSESNSSSVLRRQDSFASFLATQQVKYLLTSSIEGKVRIRRQRVLRRWISSLLGIHEGSVDVLKFLNSHSCQPRHRQTPFTCWLEDIYKMVNAESSQHNLLEYLQQVSDSVCVDQHIAIVTRRILSSNRDEETLRPCIELLKDILDDHADASVCMGSLDSPRVLALEGILSHVPAQNWRAAIGRPLIERILASQEESLEHCYLSLKSTISNIQLKLDELPRSISCFQLFEREERLRYQLDILLLTWRSIGVSGMDTIELCVRSSPHIHEEKDVSHYDCYCRTHDFTSDLKKRVCPLGQTSSTWEYISIITMVQLLLDSKIRIPSEDFDWQGHLRERNSELVQRFLQYEFSGKNLRRLLSVVSPRELYKTALLCPDENGLINLWDMIMKRKSDLLPYVFWHADVGHACLGLFAVTLSSEKTLECEPTQTVNEDVGQLKTPMDISKCIHNGVATAVIKLAGQHIWILMQHLATHKRSNCNLHGDTYSPLKYWRSLKLISSSLNMTTHELFPYWDKLSAWFLPESVGIKPTTRILTELAASAELLRDRNVSNPVHEDIPWIDPFNALTIVQCIGAYTLQNASSMASQTAIAAATNALLHPQLSILVHNGDFPLHVIRRMLRQVSLISTVAEPQNLFHELQTRITNLLNAHWKSTQNLQQTSVSASDSGRVGYFRTLMIHHGFLCWWIVSGDSVRLLKQMPTLITIAMDGCLQCMEWWKQVKVNDSVDQSKSAIILQGVISRTFQYASYSLSKLLYLMKLSTELKNDVLVEDGGTNTVRMIKSVSGALVSLCWSMMQFPEFEVLSHAAFTSWCLASLCKGQISQNVGPWEKLSKILLRWIVACARLGVLYGGMFSCPEDVTIN